MAPDVFLASRSGFTKLLFLSKPISCLCKREMPRARVTEVAQRPSPRGAPPKIRTSSSDSDPTHIRPWVERSPKIANGRTQRGTQSNPLNQKKLGTRISDLESQLGLAQEELKILKNHLVTTETAKKVVHDQLEKKPKKPRKASEPLEIKGKHLAPAEVQRSTKKEGSVMHEASDDIQEETDVFEVPIEKTTVEPKVEPEVPAEEDELKQKSVSLSAVSPANTEPENPLVNEPASKNVEINLLKTNIDEKEKELDVFREKNASLKSQVAEKSLKISSAQSEIEDLNQRLTLVTEELVKSKSSAVQASEKLEATERAKELLENEMKIIRVQTEQWRKAAEAAASVIAGGMEGNGRRISERCGSMDKLYRNMFDDVGGYNGYVGSPGLIEDGDDVLGGEKRKGIRMFGELWKKKSQK